MYNGKQGHSFEAKMVWRQKHEDESKLEDVLVGMQVFYGK